MNQSGGFPELLFLGLSIGSILLNILAFVAALYLIRYVMGIKRLLEIAEENLALNRERTGHAEKAATVLVAIRDQLDKDVPPK